MRTVMDGNRGSWAALAALAVGLVLSSVLPAAGQMMQPKTAPPPQTPQPTLRTGQNAAAEQPPVSKEEDDAYQTFFGLTNQQSAEVISQGEAFLSKYPTSRYRSSVYARLVTGYLNSNQSAKVVATGEKAIGENPDNVEVLALLSTIIPRTVDPRSLDADQKLSQAEKYARHALEVVGSMPKPEGRTDEQFAAAKNELLGIAHYGLGLVNFRRGNTAGTVEELELASKLDPSPDPLVFFLLGSGDMKLKKYPEAAAAFDRCAKAHWDNPQWQTKCQQGEQEAKQAAAVPPKP